MITKENIDEYRDGFIKGIPVCLGYLPVSFTFGLMAVSGGLARWLTIFTSLSNLTSAGQFAGVQLIFAGAGLFEIALTTFVINMRYMLMSLSLSQKIAEGTQLWKRLIFGFGITDEIFAIASIEKKKLTAAYMFGLMTTPIFGWTLGTALGAFTSGILPARLAAAMGIALYAMFIAIIIPPAKKSKAVMITIIEATVIMCIFKYVHFFDFISDGFKIIIATMFAAGISAAFFPVKEEDTMEADDTADSVNAAEAADEMARSENEDTVILIETKQEAGI